MVLLGISAFYHDSSACLLINGEILAAAQEERFTRKKNDFNYPVNAINYVLEEANLNFDEINFVIYYEKPLIKFERLLETYIDNFPKGFKQFKRSISIWIKEKFFLKFFLLKEFRKLNTKFRSNQLLFSEHHLSHAASAFYPSPFQKAVILVIDGVGEWASTSVMIGENDTNPNDSDLRKTVQAMRQGQHRFARAKNFYQLATIKAAELGVDFEWIFTTVPNVGHTSESIAPIAAELFFNSLKN